MSVTLSLTDVQIFTALRSFLLAILPAGTEVVKGLDNRVSEPAGSNFVIMMPLLRERLGTNTVSYVPTVAFTRSDLAPTQVSIQLDVHGPLGADNAQTIITLFRSEWAVDQFATYGYDITPLFTSDPRQLPFENAEQQIEVRYSIDVVLQANVITTVSQQFANAINIGLVDIDVEFHP